MFALHTPVEWALAHLAALTGSLPAALVLFTVAYRTLLLPLALHSVRHTRLLADLQERTADQPPEARREAMVQFMAEHPVALGLVSTLVSVWVSISLFRLAPDWALGTLGAAALGVPDPTYLLPLAAALLTAANLLVAPTRQAVSKMQVAMVGVSFAFLTFLPAGLVLHRVLDLMFTLAVSVGDRWG